MTEKQIKKQIKKCQCSINSYTPPEREYQYSEAEKIGMNHKANKCKGINDIKLYERNGKKIYLCSCCFFSNDKLIK